MIGNPVNNTLFLSIYSGNVLAWKASKEEQAATWSFVIFDKNKNKMLDRNEWKAFKEIVIGVKTLKRCGKKLPRYCDINKDRQISMTEWLDCLNVHQGMFNSWFNFKGFRDSQRRIMLIMGFTIGDLTLGYSILFVGTHNVVFKLGRNYGNSKITM